MLQKEVLLMTHLYINLSPILNAAGFMTHLELQGSLDDIIFWATGIFFTRRLFSGSAESRRILMSTKVTIHWRRFAPVVPTLMIHNWSLQCYLHSSLIVKCLIMYDSSGWPLSLISHQHQHILRCLATGQIGRWHHLLHSAKVVFTSPKSTVTGNF